MPAPPFQRADPPAARVRFVLVDRTNAHCPDQAQLRSAAVARLSYDPFVMNASSTLYATISRTARGLRGEIRLEDPAGKSGAHQIESISGDCTELGKAMALAISIAIDPVRMYDGPSMPATNGAGWADRRRRTGVSSKADGSAGTAQGSTVPPGSPGAPATPQKDSKTGRNGEEGEGEPEVTPNPIRVPEPKISIFVGDRYHLQLVMADRQLSVPSRRSAAAGWWASG